MIEKLPPEVDHFQEGRLPDTNEQRRIENADFSALQFLDYQHRILARLCVLVGVGVLLFGQNIVIFCLVFFAIKSHVGSLQWFLGSLIAGTLTETYFILRLIIKWLFNEVEYRPHSDSNKTK